jgi:acyl-CoA dehydrogenase family protein 9
MRSVLHSLPQIRKTAGVAVFDTSRGAVSRFGVPTRGKRTLIPKEDLSFARRLFYGDLDGKQIMPFPQALDDEARDTLGMLVDPIGKFFTEGIDSTKIDLEHKIPDDVMDSLRELGLFGLQIPEEYEGLGLSNTAYARVVEELVMDASIAVTLMAHQSIGLKGILLCGTEEQKAKYLPKLASGEHIAAFALTEPSAGSDAAGIKTKATPTEDGEAYLINGSKMWISNGGIADVFTLFAKTPDDKVTAFIVEKGFGGITAGKPETKLGIRGSNTVQLSLEDVRVPKENVLGEVSGGFKVAMTILNNGRFGLGAGTGGAIRKLMGQIGEYADTRTQFGKPLKEFGIIKDKFATMAMKAYAIESMAYLTTALIDTTERDCAVEAAMCKVFGSEAMWESVNECIQIMGGMGFMAGEGAPPYERFMRDTRILQIFEGTNEILRLMIAGMCLQGPGAELAGLGKKMSSPANIPGLLPTLAKKAGRRFGLGADALEGVAPQLSGEAKMISVLTARFGDAVDTTLRRHGKDIINHQADLARLADLAINLYAMSATISRCSTTVAEGSSTADHEVKLTQLLCKRLSASMGQSFMEIYGGAEHNGDALVDDISEEFFANDHTYLPAHPLRV